MSVRGSIRALSVFPFTICPWLGTRVLCEKGIDRWSKVRRTVKFMFVIYTASNDLWFGTAEFLINSAMPKKSILFKGARDQYV